MTRRLLFMITLLLLVLPFEAQDARGVIVIGLPQVPEVLATLQPNQCNDPLCQQLVAMLLPPFRAHDPQTGVFVPADSDSYGLVESFEFDGDDIIVYTLRDDLSWHDGTLITAYDVYYSYLNAAPEGITGAVPLDSNRIAMLYETADCAALDRTNFTIVPTLDPNFEALVRAYFNPEQDLKAQSIAWFEDDVYRRPSINMLDIIDSGRTAGPYYVAELHPLESLRLHAVDSEQAVVFNRTPEARSIVDTLFRGDVALVTEPPFDRRAELIAQDDLLTAHYPSLRAYYIRFNLTDPQAAQPELDENGQQIEPKSHPILGDRTVREAVRYGIDVQALIDATTNGYGTALTGSQPPHSWAANPDLEPAAYDPGRAMRLLEDAGWRDSNRDGLRECVRCASALPNQRLQFNLAAFDMTVANLIAQQLQKVGIGLQVIPFDAVDLSISDQRRQFPIDAYLAVAVHRYPYAPDSSTSLLVAGDALPFDRSVGAFLNPRVEALLHEARTFPGCDVQDRTPLYQEAEMLIAQDLSEIWLFSPDTMVAVQDRILGFDPVPHDPMWNISQWSAIAEEAHP